MLKVPEHSGTLIVPENLLGAKQFSSVEIRLNGDAVSRRSCANEYLMGSYFQYITNMAADYAPTSGMAYGIFDTYSLGRKAFTDDKVMADMSAPHCDRSTGTPGPRRQRLSAPSSSCLVYGYLYSASINSDLPYTNTFIK